MAGLDHCGWLAGWLAGLDHCGWLAEWLNGWLAGWVGSLMQKQKILENHTKIGLSMVDQVVVDGAASSRLPSAMSLLMMESVLESTRMREREMDRSRTPASYYRYIHQVTAARTRIQYHDNDTVPYGNVWNPAWENWVLDIPVDLGSPHPFLRFLRYDRARGLVRRSANASDYEGYFTPFDWLGTRDEYLWCIEQYVTNDGMAGCITDWSAWALPHLFYS